MTLAFDLLINIMVLSTTITSCCIGFSSLLHEGVVYLQSKFDNHFTVEDVKAFQAKLTEQLAELDNLTPHDGDSVIDTTDPTVTVGKSSNIVTIDMEDLGNLPSAE